MQVVKDTYGAPCTNFCTLYSLYIVCLFYLLQENGVTKSCAIFEKVGK